VLFAGLATLEKAARGAVRGGHVGVIRGRLPGEAEEFAR